MLPWSQRSAFESVITLPSLVFKYFCSLSFTSGWLFCEVIHQWRINSKLKYKSGAEFTKLCTSFDSCSSNAKNTLDRSCAYKYSIESITENMLVSLFHKPDSIMITFSVCYLQQCYKFSMQTLPTSFMGRRNEINLHWGWLDLSCKTD